jgi:DNA adenine methylase
VNTMNTTALAPWFGSNRMLAKHVGQELDGCNWVGVAFAGGMCELAHIGARSLVVNDAHRHMINYARVAADPKLGPKLYRHLRRVPSHPVALVAAQSRCVEREQTHADPYTGGMLFQPDKPAMVTGPDLEWAVDYFVAAWMSRNGTAGTKGEFNAGMSVRWDAGGGDSATRVRSAVASLVAWRRVLRRANFTTLDAFDFIDTKVKDEAGIGLYCDPPFPGPGDAYKHTFGEDGQRRLADAVGRFTRTKVVMRFYDHPLVRALYPEDRWTWVLRTGRKQTNGDAPEALLLNTPTLAKAGAA